MKIGVDFDNTIVSYDKVFHKVALEQSLIKSNLNISKIAVRDYLREQGQNNIWTELQGYVYGERMLDAVLDTVESKITSAIPKVLRKL